MATTISLPQAVYWPQQLLPSLTLSYAIDPPLPEQAYVLAFVPEGGGVTPQYQLPFAPRSGSGTVPIPGTNERVPWSRIPPPEGAYNWTIRLQSSSGTVHASTTLQIVAPPTLMNLVYDGASVVAQFVPVTVGAPSHYTLAVVGSLGTLTGKTPNAFESVIEIRLPKPLTGSATFALATVGAGTNVSSGAAAPMMIEQPAIASSSYDGATLAAQWMPSPGATVYLMQASSSTRPLVQRSVNVPIGFMPAPGLDDSYTFAVFAAATPPIYAVSAAQGLLLPRPRLSAGAYDGAAVTARWSPVTGATSYTMLAAAEGGPSFQQDVPGAEGRFPAANLDPALPYTFEVFANASGKVSAASGATRMLLRAPAGASLGYADAKQQLVAVWRASTEPGVTGYVVDLQKNGASLQQQTTPNLTHTFAQDLETGALFRAVVRATDGVMVGPPSSGGDAPVALAMTATFDGFARLTQEQWTLGGQTQTYTYTLDDPGNIVAAAYASVPADAAATQRR